MSSDSNRRASPPRGGPPEDEPLFLLDRRPDGLEVGVRSVCGFVFGALVGVYVWLRHAIELAPWAAAVLVLTLACGTAFFAARYGDRFWVATSDFVRRSWL